MLTACHVQVHIECNHSNTLMFPLIRVVSLLVIAIMYKDVGCADNYVIVSIKDVHSVAYVLCV